MMASEASEAEMNARFRFDGAEVSGCLGEPIAAALMRAGYVALARSPKYHRPRGPACFRSACDGCLARVDGEPNVMTCRAPLRDGSVVESQNTLGPRRFDLLRAADWFFPRGMNHHELFAGVPGVQDIMQSFARRVAGLGTMPTEVVATKAATRIARAALVIGAGPAGMTLANALAQRGLAPLVIDEGLVVGGSLLSLPAKLRAAFASTEAAFAEHVQQGRIELALGTIAGGLFGRDVLVVGRDDGARIASASRLFLCTGAHDGVAAFAGNDMPGIVSVRAAGRLLQLGAVPAKTRIAFVQVDASCTLSEAWADEAREHFTVEHVRGTPLAARGKSRVRGISVAVDGVTKNLTADLVAIDAPLSPAYELAAHARATLTPEPRGFVPRRGPDGTIAAGVWAFGELAGDPLDADTLRRDATFLAASVGERP